MKKPTFSFKLCLALMLIGSAMAVSGFAMGAHRGVYWDGGFHAHQIHELQLDMALPAFSHVVASTMDVDLTIREGDQFWITAQGQTTTAFNATVVGDTLQVGQGSQSVLGPNFDLRFLGTRRGNNQVVVTVPHGTTLDSVDLSSFGRGITVQALDMDELGISTFGGRIQVSNVSVQHATALSSFGGNIEASGHLNGQVTANSHGGNITLNLPHAREYYGYEISTFGGSINLPGHTHRGHQGGNRSQWSSDPVAQLNMSTFGGNINVGFGTARPNR